MNQHPAPQGVPQTNGRDLRVALAKPGGQMGKDYSAIGARGARAIVQLKYAQTHSWLMHTVGLGLEFEDYTPPKATLGLIVCFSSSTRAKIPSSLPKIRRSLPAADHGQRDPTRRHRASCRWDQTDEPGEQTKKPREQTDNSWEQTKEFGEQPWRLRPNGTQIITSPCR